MFVNSIKRFLDVEMVDVDKMADETTEAAKLETVEHGTIDDIIHGKLEAFKLDESLFKELKQKEIDALRARHYDLFDKLNGVYDYFLRVAHSKALRVINEHSCRGTKATHYQVLDALMQNDASLSRAAEKLRYKDRRNIDAFIKRQIIRFPEIREMLGKIRKIHENRKLMKPTTKKLDKQQIVYEVVMKIRPIEVIEDGNKVNKYVDRAGSIGQAAKLLELSRSSVCAYLRQIAKIDPDKAEKIKEIHRINRRLSLALVREDKKYCSDIELFIFCCNNGFKTGDIAQRFGYHIHKCGSSGSAWNRLWVLYDRHPITKEIKSLQENPAVKVSADAGLLHVCMRNEFDLERIAKSVQGAEARVNDLCQKYDLVKQVREMYDERRASSTNG